MTVAVPHIEFKGIPTALEQDSYFDVNKWNLIVFDDQMIDASKDKRIVNLFTCGSHHRKLGVIYIVRAESIPSGERQPHICFATESVTQLSYRPEDRFEKARHPCCPVFFAQLEEAGRAKEFAASDISEAREEYFLETLLG